MFGLINPLSGVHFVPAEKLSKGRIPYIDSTKGILILLLIVHHIIYVGLRKLEYHDCFLESIRYAQIPFMATYFMQAFFLITGLCSNFDKPYLQFLRGQIRTLIVPQIVFTLVCYHPTSLGMVKWLLFLFTHNGGEYWFLTALFFAKNIYYVINKYVRNNVAVLSIFLVLSLLGTYLRQIGLSYNYFFYVQILDLALFLAIGNRLKSVIRMKRVQAWFCGVYILVVFIMIWLGISFPCVTAGSNTTVDNWLYHILLSLTGSVGVLFVGQLFNCSLLRGFGENSLMGYISHLAVLVFFMKAFSAVYTAGNYWNSAVVTMALCIVVATVVYVICQLFQNKYLSWTLGKF